MTCASPASASRSQFLDSQYIHVVLLQNAKERGRVGRAAPGVHREQAQPKRCRSRSRSARWSWRSLETSPPERRQLPHHQQRGRDRKQSRQPPGRVRGDDHGGDRGHSRQRGQGRQFRARIRGIPAASRASSAGNAKAIRIKAVTQVTPCLFSPACRCGRLDLLQGLTGGGGGAGTRSVRDINHSAAGTGAGRPAAGPRCGPAGSRSPRAAGDRGRLQVREASSAPARSDPAISMSGSRSPGVARPIGGEEGDLAGTGS